MLEHEKADTNCPDHDCDGPLVSACYNLLQGHLVAIRDDTYTSDCANMYHCIDLALEIGGPYLEWVWSPHVHSCCPFGP